MSYMYHYCSVSKALEELTKNGYTYDFNIHDKEIIANPTHFEIQHIYRYEGDSNPDDEAIVYGIKSIDGLCGVFVTGFSANSQTDASQILIDISIKGR
ncbi:hypothetical protein SAMN05444396_10125 [Flavobacterium segetis]|uniref:Phosphoribosylpyrophosphate synthetase n=1 Tax=Flavobacterium segetis TaxID=271157 RepID=A0A1M5DWT0_9FLAO|nr:hypothetical protein [Flavobacterium segetis]SHF71488.1 hypothetical protein SAMN05444396_10125 [Flavobacterium segetis]